MRIFAAAFLLIASYCAAKAESSVAVAIGDSGYSFGMIDKSSASSAEREALAICRAKTTNPALSALCEIKSTVAKGCVTVAAGPAWAAWSSGPQQEAERSALKACASKSSSCTIQATICAKEYVVGSEVKPFKVIGMERSFGRYKDIGVSFNADTSAGVLNSGQVGITLCDEPGKERYKPSISYNSKLGEFRDAYRCVEKYGDGHKIVSQVTITSSVKREGDQYHLQGKLVIIEKGVADPNEVHIEEAIIPVDGPCRVIKYNRSNARPDLAKTFESKKIPEEIYTTPGSTCEWN